MVDRRSVTRRASERPPRKLEGATGDLAALAQAWDAALQRELPDAVELRHRLHAAPEVSGVEERTAEVVAAALGGDAEPVAGTGRVLRIGPPGPAVAVRAELDGLPMTERTGAPWASTNGAMHACGHDVHLAAVVAVTRAARQLRLPAGLVVVLQPREEVGPTGGEGRRRVRGARSPRGAVDRRRPRAAARARRER